MIAASERDRVPATATRLSDPFLLRRRRPVDESVLRPDGGVPADVGGSDVDEAARLRRVLDGDARAFAELFDALRPRLSRMVHFRLDSRLRGRIDADDVVQEAFLDASKRLDAFRASQPMSPLVWLRLIVGQTMIDVHRRHLGAQMRDAGRELSLQGPWAGNTSMSMSFCLLGRLSSPSQAALRAELSSMLATALEEMNPTDREVLALRHFEELTNKEVAEVLGIESKAASIRYVRALARLKLVLQKFPGFLDFQ